jgi:hypothetical protein
MNQMIQRFFPDEDESYSYRENCRQVLRVRSDSAFVGPCFSEVAPHESRQSLTPQR